MEKVRSAKFGVRSLPWRFGGKMMAFARIILERLELRRSISSQFWARVVEALARCPLYYFSELRSIG